jgi:hypothetical protein
VLRSLRVLRVLRLITGVPTLRRVVAGLLAALPGTAVASDQPVASEPGTWCSMPGYASAGKERENTEAGRSAVARSIQYL